MKKGRFTETQIVSALKKQEAGIAVKEISRELGISEAPLPNISITVQGYAKINTGTDAKGRFVLDVPVGAAVIFSAVPYSDYIYKVPATVSTNLQIPMLIKAADANDEVIITAYGKKVRREAVAGSVSTIKPDQLRTPASNLTSALSGQVAGVIGFQTSGQPGADNAYFFVRSVTTLGFRQSPLILIDII